MTFAALVVDTRSPVPPYEQLRGQLSEMIQSGALSAGDRLPPLRQLAADLGLAVGTVGRTYRELELAGLVHSRRGAGTRVSSSVTKAPSASERRRLLAESADAYVQSARRLSADHDEIVSALSSALERARP